MVKSVFVKTFIMTLGVFVIGFFLGSSLERSLTADLSAKIGAIENSIQDIELEALYLLTSSNSSCVFLDDVVRRTNNNLDEISTQLSSYDEKNIVFTNVDLVNIKSRYTSLLIKDWLLQNSIREKCGTNSISVLYFYKREGCPECIVQGNILTVLKGHFREKVMIFPLDHDLGVSSVGLLENNYNITKFPSVVVNEKVYTGTVGFEGLRESVCVVVSDEKCKGTGSE